MTNMGSIFKGYIKDLEKGRSSPAVTYYAFTQDTALSLVEALDEYVKRTRSFYSMFMSYIKSWIKGCSPPTITY